MTKKEFLKRCETIYEILEVAFDGKGVGEMKKEYQLYKRHHNDKFIGWGVGYEYRGRLIELATFYGRKAKEYAEHFIDVLEFDRA